MEIRQTAYQVGARLARPKMFLLISLAIGLSVIAGPRSQGHSAVGTALIQSYPPIADTYVSQRQPEMNYGDTQFLHVFSPAVRDNEQIAYLKFYVEDHGLISQAVLKLYVVESGDGGQIHRSLDNTWEESTLTYVDRPSFEAQAVTFGAVRRGQLKTLDVTSLIGTPGLRSLAISTLAPNGTTFASREHPELAPFLEVSYEAIAQPPFQGINFPAPGQSLQAQNIKAPADVGLEPGIIDQLTNQASRWALWRHGYLVYVDGDFNLNQEVKSLRKTWHALTIGAAIKQGKIPSYAQKISVWQTELIGNDADATWWHIMTQSASLDYPGCEDENDYAAGEMWTYSDLNPYHLNHALAKAYGKSDFFDNYGDVVREAYFDAIGMQGWETKATFDGIRFVFDLEDMGRLGLLMIARGWWNRIELIPSWFIVEQETKQTRAMAVNYNGCNDGIIDLNTAEFPESPYGFMTWVNTDGDYYPGASTKWAWGYGSGGTYVLWNFENGIVFAGFGVSTRPTSEGIPQIIEANIIGPNPLVE